MKSNSKIKYKEAKKYNDNILIQNLYSFYYINNKYQKYYPTNLKGDDIDKENRFN